MYTKIKCMPEGFNAKNWPGVIHIDYDCERIGSVWAQERYEAGWKLNPWNLLRFIFSKKARIKMELMGHEVEVQTAALFYGRNAKIVRFAEAHALITAYDDFDEFNNVDEVVVAMEKLKPEAERWVDDHHQEILDFMDRANMT